MVLLCSHLRTETDNASIIISGWLLRSLSSSFQPAGTEKQECRKQICIIVCAKYKICIQYFHLQDHTGHKGGGYCHAAAVVTLD